MKKKKLKKEIAELRKEIETLQAKVQELEKRRIGEPIHFEINEKELSKYLPKICTENKALFERSCFKSNNHPLWAYIQR